MNGIIQVYTGDGKGKTTAAIGLAVRAYGQGLRVGIFQFLKTCEHSGEYQVLKLLNKALTMVSFGNGQLIINRQPTEEEIYQASNGWKHINTAIWAGNYDLIIIDELSHVLNLGLISLDEVMETLEKKPEGIELVLTGRDMPLSIIRLADLVTEMKAVKHPYEHGLISRKGIEY